MNITRGHNPVSIALYEIMYYIKNMRRVHIKPGYFTLVDYVYTVINRKTTCIHRLITNAPKGMVVDHVNGNGLDNRKENLRVCTPLQNAMNKKRTKRKNSSILTSKYKGVQFQPYRSKGNEYLAMIRYAGKTYHLGTYATEEEAALAYDKKAIELAGEFALTNFGVRT